MFTHVGNKELLSKKVAIEIEAAINSQKLKVNDKLPTELELCEQFGVSRTALREALQMLSAKGLLSIEKGRGIFVRGITSDSVADPMRSYLKLRMGAPYVLEIIEARRIIEPEIAWSAALNRTMEDVQQMQKDIDEMKTFEGPAEELAKFDMDFHLTIARATQNHLLPLMLKPVFRLMPEIKSMIISDVPEARNSAIIWHTKILKAIIDKDSKQAYDEMKQHLELAVQHAKEMLKVEGLVNGEMKG
jgi:GntR family transcriptional repressor for pyruvate dehydrogenase complex